MGIWGQRTTIATKGIIPSQGTHDTAVQSGPYKLGHSDAHEMLQINPWLVPELTGAQWVELLPQASYITPLLDGMPTSC